jgi:hypothetical protein
MIGNERSNTKHILCTRDSPHLSSSSLSSQGGTKRNYSNALFKSAKYKGTEESGLYNVLISP